MALAAAAGACSSLIGSPAELLMIQQQSKCGGLVDTAKGLLEGRGALVLYRGLVRPPPPRVARELVPRQSCSVRCTADRLPVELQYEAAVTGPTPKWMCCTHRPSHAGRLQLQKDALGTEL